MKFDTTKDKELGKWECEGLQFAVKQYNGGACKLQIGPRIIDGRDDHGNPIDIFVKAGRLTSKETSFLAEHLPEIQALLSEKE